MKLFHYAVNSSLAYGVPAFGLFLTFSHLCFTTIAARRLFFSSVVLLVYAFVNGIAEKIIDEFYEIFKGYTLGKTVD